MNPRSIFSMRDLSLKDIFRLLEDAQAFGNQYQDWQLPLKKALVANLFFEPSTRTHYSFLSAALQLGCQVADFNADNSSLLKGETLYDTVKTFEMNGYDLLIIRHMQNEYYKELENINIPILNAGDGSGEHPSQCLLDLLTIYQEFGQFKDVKVLIVGDIAHSRVATSDKLALEKLGARVQFSGPPFWQRAGYPWIAFDAGIKDADVVMMLRNQRERGAVLQDMDDAAYLKHYGLNHERYALMKEKAIIMHPAPFNRDVEIASDLVESPKARIFKQMANGLLVRKAMIKYALEYPPFKEEACF